MVDFSTWLRRARAAQGMTSKELADAAGVSATIVHFWEQAKDGKALRSPSSKSLESVERALGLTRESHPFDGAALADALEAEADDGDKVTLFCRETATAPCYVGYRIEGKGSRGTVSGDGVHGVDTDARFAARLLRASDV